MCMFSKEVEIPENVNVDLIGNKVVVKGPKGSLEREFELTEDIKIEKKDGKIVVSSEKERRKIKALVGTVAAHIRNLIKGVTKGFTYKLKVVFSHFPVQVKVEKDKVLFLNFLGERTPRVAKIVGDTQVKIEGQEITVSGINPEDVGQTASNLELATRRTGYDKKVFMDGCYIVEKE
ncbi:MAG: 50S ribosomal protein L6 [Candidatus Heimdallarchaeota archaeon]